MPRRYLITWIVSVVAVLLAAAAVNAVVDPYGMTGAPRIEGFNARKPAAANRSRTVKPHLIADRAPRLLITGNSRPEMGLNPDHPCLAVRGPVFSLTLPGAGLYEQMRALQHALSLSDPATILLAADFWDFLNPSDSTRDPYAWPPADAGSEPRFAVDALGRPNAGYGRERFRTYRDALLSLTALADSAKTVFSQNTPFASTRTVDGFNPAWDYKSAIASEGQYVLFAQKEAEVRKTLARQRWGLFENSQRWSHQFEALDRVIALAKVEGADVIVFTSPYHDRYLADFEAAGLGGLIDVWKRMLVDLVVIRHGVPLWDFTRPSDYTAEPPPPAGDRQTVLKWFWEPSHYRRELGDLMLNQIFADAGCGAAPPDPPVGLRLDAAGPAPAPHAAPGPPPPPPG